VKSGETSQTFSRKIGGGGDQRILLLTLRKKREGCHRRKASYVHVEWGKGEKAANGCARTRVRNAKRQFANKRRTRMCAKERCP